MVNLPGMGGFAGGSEESFHTNALLENRLIRWKIMAKFLFDSRGKFGAVLDMKAVQFQETCSLRLLLISDRPNDFFFRKLFGSIIDGTAMINCRSVPLFVPYYLDDGEKNCRNSLIHIKI